MSEYSNVPLNTPTKVDDNGDIETWVIRATSGLSIEQRPKAGAATDLRNQREARLTAAIATLRSWAVTARATTVTSGNNVATTQTIVNNLGTFYDRFADLLQSMGKG